MAYEWGTTPEDALNGAEAVARDNGWRIANPSVAELVQARGGKCPCAQGVTCPCAGAASKIKREGECHCGLFAAGEVHDGSQG